MTLPGSAQVIEKERPQLAECEEPSIYSPAFPREKWQRKRTQVKIRVGARLSCPQKRGLGPSPRYPRPYGLPGSATPPVVLAPPPRASALLLETPLVSSPTPAKSGLGGR